MVQMNSAPLRSAALIEDDSFSVAPKKTRRQQKRSGANKKRTPGAAVMLQKHYAQMPSAEVVEDLHGSTQLHLNEDVERGVAMMQQSTAQCQTTLLEMEPEVGSAMLQKNAAQAPAKVPRSAVQEDDGQGHWHARKPANSKKHVDKEVSTIAAHDNKVTDTATEDKKLLGHKAQKTAAAAAFDGDDKKARGNETKADVAAAGMRAREAGTFDADDHEAGEEGAEEEEQQQDADQGAHSAAAEETEGEEEEQEATGEPTQIMTTPNKILSKDMATPKKISSKEPSHTEKADVFPVDARFKDKYNHVEKEDRVVQESVAAVTKTDKTNQEAASIQRSTVAKQAHKAHPKKAASPVKKAQAVGAKEKKGKVMSQLAMSVHFDEVNPESDRKTMKGEDEDVKPKESGHPCRRKEGCPGDR